MLADFVMWSREDVRRARHPVVAAGVRALGHVGEGGTHVAVGPERPVELDISAGSNLSMKSSW
jgi:hypothetical protein